MFINKTDTNTHEFEIDGANLHGASGLVFPPYPLHPLLELALGLHQLDHLVEEAVELRLRDHRSRRLHGLLEGTDELLKLINLFIYIYIYLFI